VNRQRINFITIPSDCGLSMPNCQYKIQLSCHNVASRFDFRLVFVTRKRSTCISNRLKFAGTRSWRRMGISFRSSSRRSHFRRIELSSVTVRAEDKLFFRPMKSHANTAQKEALFSLNVSRRIHGSFGSRVSRKIFRSSAVTIGYWIKQSPWDPMESPVIRRSFMSESNDSGLRDSIGAMEK